MTLATFVSWLNGLVEFGRFVGEQPGRRAHEASDGTSAVVSPPIRTSVAHGEPCVWSSLPGAMLLRDFRDVEQVSEGGEGIRTAIRGDDDVKEGFGALGPALAIDDSARQ